MMDVSNANDNKSVVTTGAIPESSQPNVIYTVLAPGTIRSNFRYNAAVSIHSADGPCNVSIGFAGPSFSETKSVEVQPKTMKDVEFNIPKLNPGDYYLTLRVVCDNTIIEEKQQLYLKDNDPHVLIQTDKSTYKPADLVKFRVLVMDENLRSLKDDTSLKILIIDDAQNRIKQWSEAKPYRGVYTGQLQLSEQPVLGNWTIEVILADGKKVASQSFEVDKYVLPKFSVSIESAKDVAIAEGVIKVAVCAKYTYGKSVKGKATVRACMASPSCGFGFIEKQNNSEAEKTIDIDGKGYIEFDLTRDLQLPEAGYYLPPLQIAVEMEEELTGCKQSATNTVNLHRQSYKLESVDTPFYYKPGELIVYKVAVKHVDDSPVRHSNSCVKLILEANFNPLFNRCLIPNQKLFGVPDTKEAEANESDVPKSLEFESKISPNGLAIFEIFVPTNAPKNYGVKCSYLDSSAYMPILSKAEPTKEETNESQKLHLRTEKPKLGEDVSVEFKANESIQFFVYTITGRGNILKVEQVITTEENKTHIIRFTPTFEMVPKATLYVHYVHENLLQFEEIDINFEKNFQNKISISSQAEAQPGEKVNIDIKTAPDSFVGLLGVDQSVLLLKSGNDLNKDTIFDNLNRYDTATPWNAVHYNYPGRLSGLVTMTNAEYKRFEEVAYCCLGAPASGPVLFGSAAPRNVRLKMRSVDVESLSMAPQPKPQIRKEFPESWLFENIENVKDGTFTLVEKIPDTITSWIITGFSLSPKTGLSITESPTTIRTFRPFFVSTNLPYSIKRGELITIPVVLFNYTKNSLDAQITLENTDDEFDFTDTGKDPTKRVGYVKVASDSGEVTNFQIRAKRIGYITLKIAALSQLAGDAIQKMLKVEPEGVPVFDNHDFYLNAKDAQSLENKLSLGIPKDIVPDSEVIEVSVMGDLMSSTISNLDQLVRKPYGCGEQNMVNFVPNILVLKYLECVNQLTPSIEQRAKRYLEVGYQRELTFKHDDGSYSAFGMCDKSGSTWLTAYVIRTFQQAAKYTDIDPKVVQAGLEFLAGKQDKNGSFVEHGKLFDFKHHNAMGLTAFVLLALLENTGESGKYEKELERGFHYLENRIKEEEDLYAVALATYALQLRASKVVPEAIKNLDSCAKIEKGFKWWSKQSSDSRQSASSNVEVTAYILMTLLEMKQENLLPIVKYVLSQRNSNGGFHSTQETVVALQALIKFAEKVGADKADLTVEVKSAADKSSVQSFRVNKDNALLLQTVKLASDVRQVEFCGKGLGTAILQISYRYNVLKEEEEPSFKLNTHIQPNSTPAKLVMDVEVEYLKNDTTVDGNETNMVVVEISLPSGYNALLESFQNIKEVESVKCVETKNEDTKIIVYFESLKHSDVKKIPIEALRTHEVESLKPAPIVVYDYYDTQRSSTCFYQI